MKIANVQALVFRTDLTKDAIDFRLQCEKYAITYSSSCLGVRDGDTDVTWEFRVEVRNPEQMVMAMARLSIN